MAGAWRSLRRRAASRFEERLPWYILLATIPGALFGALGEAVIESELGEPALVAVELMVFGVVLYAADRWSRHRRPLDALGGRDAAAIGMAQALSLMPGVSRSGITMTAGLGLRLTREAATRFSFLISIPVVAGAVLYKAWTTFVGGEGLPAGSGAAFVVGIATSMVTGFWAVWFLLRYVRTRSFAPFVFYRLAAGVVVLSVFATRL